MKDHNRSALKRLKTLTFTITFALLFVLFTLPVQAAKWELAVPEAADRVSHYVDTESIQVTGKTVKYWTKQILPEPDNYAVASRVLLVQIDPSRRTITLLYAVGYSASGDYVFGEAANISSPIIPGSVFEAEANYVCKLTGVKLRR